MKKRNIILIISIALVFVGIVLLLNKNDNKAFIQDGVTYALIVDGKRVNSFPEKGLYKVKTECIHAKCIWNYDEWKLYLEEIEGDVSANITFTTIEKQNLNDHIVSLSGTNQGSGELVNERIDVPNFEESKNLTLSEYGQTSQFSATSDSATSGTTVSNIFSFNGSEWQTDPTKLQARTYYNLQFTIPSDGHYQMCYYAKSGTKNDNGLAVYNGNARIQWFSVSYSNTAKKCVHIGKFSAGTTLRIMDYPYNAISDVVIGFSIQKAANVRTDNSYRYEGKNPNNYVWFNNELWRMIGVFDSGSHGQVGENLVKIIRSESIGGIAWDSITINNWSTSSLKKLLNPVSSYSNSGSYYNRKNGTDSGYCFGYYNLRSNCDYTIIGISDKYRPLIKNVTWYLGGADTTNITVDAMYRAERGEKVYKNNPTTDTGYIGLMYPSDYGYSVLSSSCARTTNLGSYSSAVCAGQSWLNEAGTEYMISAESNNENWVFLLNNSGSLSANNCYNSYQIRPTLYLDSSVYVIDGDGSANNPYIMGM